ncbi:hypothetical protein CANCADRAFT_56105 [Tortispora caseinolytica NRRL Y-17796]|uniref:Class I unconventional myosin n=1 Tax=Tortispora caseinolytica NRRL Y-17796 TaxID=767744 RepID=A0A1E4TL20_9ASCO|nr:hypothetical protein CANCADRAFT_56105 [Tortispora caseinolytica NRRL Y-17796]
MAITKRTKKGTQTPASNKGVKKAAFDATKKKEVGVSDLTLLSKISEEAINDNLYKRFQNGSIYTYIGHVLISVNPFRDLGIYGQDTIDAYRGKNRLEVPPHVFAIAESAYYNMKAYNENQCVIISGESGAGKTEAAKQIMQYISSVSGGSSSSQIQRTKDMVLATNPLLEAFGCAKTLRNNNSSRFGKYLEMLFDAQGQPVGAHITNYLLEKGRVVEQTKNERNFHIFYQFTKGAPQKYREMFGVQQPEAYVYLSKSGCTTVDGMDDVREFQETLNAMKTIGLSEQEQENIFRMLAAILWIGNVSFRENAEGNAEIADPSVTTFVAYLLNVDEAMLRKAFSIRIVETRHGARRGSVYESPLNIVQATAVRDALAKAIYFNLFDWIVERVNQSLAVQGARDKSIGILDIYGFEIFEQNSFEQLCINYVNEKLQQIFIELTLKAEQEEYVREQIKWTPIKYFNNKIVCDLIESKRPAGIFAALNDACATAHADSDAADQAFIQRMSMLASNPHFEPRQSQYLVKHYAGEVTYQIRGMTDKNKDVLLRDLVDLVQSSTNSFLVGLFPDTGSSDSKRRPPTASDKIKASANELVAALERAQPSYIRTIKPNQNKSPSEYDQKQVLHQIKYLGLQENVRIRRAGFAYRQTFEKFVERFYLLSGRTSYAGDYIWQGDHISATKQILTDANIPVGEYQMGVSKVFIKTPETLFALEHMRDRYWHGMAARIQRAWRAYLRRKAEAAMVIQRAWRRKQGPDRHYLELREQGHSILAGRKERRRFSLLAQRRFLGDYLALESHEGSGAYLRNAVGIPGGEKIYFSCTGEMLLAKFGRSSTRLPRTFILTNRGFYIVSREVINRQLQVVRERVIPVSSIKSMNMSNLRDDWFSLIVVPPQQPDPFAWCQLKTELATQLRQLNPGIEINIGPTVSYCKKTGKMHSVKFQRDITIPSFDMYKSGVVHVPPGEPANSVSDEPRSKSKISSSTPSVRPAQTNHAVVGPTKPKSDGTAAAAAAAAMNANGNAASSASVAPPPPPPVAPPAKSKPSEPSVKALYAFDARSDNEITIAKDEILLLLQKSDNGWWLCKKLDGSATGWAPTTYLEEVTASKAAPPPPPPPTNPKPKRKPATAAAASASGTSGGDVVGGLANAIKQKESETRSFAGGLADALKKRQGRMQDSDDEQENDDW